MAVPTSQPDPTCPLCSEPVTSGSLVLFEHGELLHVRCMSERLGLGAPAETDRPREARTRAAENLDRATRLLDELRQGRNLPPGPPAGP